MKNVICNYSLKENLRFSLHLEVKTKHYILLRITQIYISINYSENNIVLRISMCPVDGLGFIVLMHEYTKCIETKINETFSKVIKDYCLKNKAFVAF